MTRNVALFASALFLVGCEGQKAPIGLDEPIRVHSAQFIAGDLPGSAPITDEQADAGVAPSGPHVTFFESQNRVITPGEADKRFAGRATTDAFSVAIRFADLGTGYWVLPVSGPDPQNGEELTWNLSCDFSAAAPPGLHSLRFAAIDGNGTSGTEQSLDVCLVPPYPDNLNACDPKIAPPAAVVTLSWDVGADVDLRVAVPGGQVIDAKSPLGAPSEPPDGGTDGGATPAAGPAKVDPAIGLLDHDSNGGCALDGQNRESVVFQEQPQSGTYQIYANLFDACGQKAVHFRVSVHLASAGPNGTHSFVEVLSRSGYLGAADANGGDGPGLFVTELTLD